MRRIWIAAALLAAGCGTTVNLPAGSASLGGGDLSVPPATTPTAPAVTAPSALQPTSSAKSAHPSTSVVTGVPSTTATTGSASPGQTPVNHDPIQIGFITTGEGNASQLGVNAGSSYSDQAMFSALVAEYNAHGGIDGHRIVPVFGSTDTASSNWSNQFQSVCAKFTQDNHVQAVIGYIFVFLPSFENCLAGKDVAHLYGGYQPGDVVDQQRYSTMVSTANPTTDGALLAPLDGGLRTGLLNKSTKLGLLLDTCADGDRAVSRTVVPWLKAHGIPYESVLGNCAQGATDVGGAVSAIANAELRFAASGVKVVMGSGLETLLFMTAANLQGYRPQYLTNVGGAALAANAPRPELANLHGFGWLPAVDVDPGHQPYPRTASQKACLAMLAKHGLKAKQYNDFMTAYAACDGLNLYAKALAAGARTAQQVATDVAAAENSYRSALDYGGRMRTTTTQHGGPGEYRQYAWSGSCSCLMYKGPTYPMPPS